MERAQYQMTILLLLLLLLLLSLLLLLLLLLLLPQPVSELRLGNDFISIVFLTCLARI